MKAKNKISRDEFITEYWNYYKHLEDDFANLKRFVEIDEINYNTCSNEIIKQFCTVCAEIDILFKLVCKFKLSKNANITRYYEIIKENYNEIFGATIIVLHSEIIIKPFQEWEKIKNGKNVLFWWQDYGKIKHNRSENYEKGKFENLLNSLAALYYLELFLLRRIGTDNNEMDVPNSVSKIFKLQDFKTKYTVTGDEMYPMILEEIDEIFNSKGVDPNE